MIDSAFAARSSLAVLGIRKPFFSILLAQSSLSQAFWPARSARVRDSQAPRTMELMSAEAFGNAKMTEPMDVDEPGKWPEKVFTVVSQWAERLTNATGHTCDLPLDLGLERPSGNCSQDSVCAHSASLARACNGICHARACAHCRMNRLRTATRPLTLWA